MSKHRLPGFHPPRLLLPVRPWMWALATGLWAAGGAAGAAREMPALGIWVCLGFVALCAWRGGALAGEETYKNEEQR